MLKQYDFYTILGGVLNGITEDKYLFLDGDGELGFCLDNETGKIVNWGSDNCEVYPEADDLQTFIMAQLEDGKENW